MAKAEWRGGGHGNLGISESVGGTSGPRVPGMLVVGGAGIGAAGTTSGPLVLGVLAAHPQIMAMKIATTDRRSVTDEIFHAKRLRNAVFITGFAISVCMRQ